MTKKQTYSLILFCSFWFFASIKAYDENAEATIHGNNSDYSEQKIFVAYNQGGMTSTFPVLSKIAAKRKSSAGYSPKYVDETSSGLTAQLKQLLREKSGESSNAQINAGYGTNAYKQGGYTGHPDAQTKATSGLLGAMAGKFGKNGIRNQIGGYGSHYGNYNGMFGNQNENQFQFGASQSSVDSSQYKTNSFSQQTMNQQNVQQNYQIPSQPFENYGYGQQTANSWGPASTYQNGNNYLNFPKSSNPSPGFVGESTKNYNFGSNYNTGTSQYTKANPSPSLVNNNFNHYGYNIGSNFQNYFNSNKMQPTSNNLYSNFNSNTGAQTIPTGPTQNNNNVNNCYQNYQANQNGGFGDSYQPNPQKMTYFPNTFNYNAGGFSAGNFVPQSPQKFQENSGISNTDESPKFYPQINQNYYQAQTKNCNFQKNYENQGNNQNQQEKQNYENFNAYNSYAQPYPAMAATGISTTYSSQMEPEQSYLPMNEQEEWQENNNSDDIEPEINNNVYPNSNMYMSTTQNNWEQSFTPRNFWPFSGMSSVGNYGSSTHSKKQNTYNVMAPVPAVSETKTYKHGSNVYTSSYSGFDSALEKFSGDKAIGDVYNNNFGDSERTNFYASQPKLGKKGSREPDN